MAVPSYSAISEITPAAFEAKHQPESSPQADALLNGPDTAVAQEDADRRPVPLFGLGYRNVLEVTVTAAEQHAPSAAYSACLHQEGHLQFVVHESQVVTVVVCDALGNQMVQLYNDWVYLGETVTVVIDDTGWPAGTYSIRTTSKHFTALQGFTLTR